MHPRARHFLPWLLLLLFVWIVGSTLHERLARRAGKPAGARHSWLMLLL